MVARGWSGGGKPYPGARGVHRARFPGEEAGLQRMRIRLGGDKDSTAPRRVT